MKLYHGTTEAVARAALTEGLKPRQELGIKSLWDVESHPDYVYLTAAYAPYFAAHAASSAAERAESDSEGRWAIVEVDTDLLDESALHPDEDALEQGTRGPEGVPEWLRDGCEYEGLDPNDMEDRTLWFRNNLYSFQEHWTISIEALGNCCHEGTIPAAAITRVALFDPETNGYIASTVLDPAISIMNYNLLGGKYRALTRWFFEADVGPLDIDNTLDAVVRKEVAADTPLGKHMTKQHEVLTEWLAKRGGLEVVTP